MYIVNAALGCKHQEASSDCNWTRTHNHLIRKQTLNYLAKLAFTCLYTLDIQTTIKCGFTLKRVRDIIRTYNQEASFISLDDLDNVSILLDEDNDLEEEITLYLRN